MVACARESSRPASLLPSFLRLSSSSFFPLNDGCAALFRRAPIAFFQQQEQDVIFFCFGGAAKRTLSCSTLGILAIFLSGYVYLGYSRTGDISLSLSFALSLALPLFILQCGALLHVA